MLNVSLFGIRKTLLIFVHIKWMTQCFVVCLPSGSSFVTQALTNQRGITGCTSCWEIFQLNLLPPQVFCFEMFVKSGMQQLLVVLLPQILCDFKILKRSKHRIVSEKQYYVHRHKIVVGRVYTGIVVFARSGWPHMSSNTLIYWSRCFYDSLWLTCVDAI